MAAVSTVERNAVSIKLNNGTSQGKVLTTSVSLGTLAASGFDADKALNIVDKLEEVFTKSIVRVEHTQVAYLSRY